MPLDYSQKRLISAPLGKARGRRGQRLQMYAFFTGLASTLISLASVVVMAVKK